LRLYPREYSGMPSFHWLRHTYLFTWDEEGRYVSLKRKGFEKKTPKRQKVEIVIHRKMKKKNEKPKTIKRWVVSDMWDF